MLEIETPYKEYVLLQKNGPIFVSTNSLSTDDFSTFLETSDLIEKSKKNRNVRIKKQNSLRIKKTREEVFEVSAVDEVQFIKALEDNGANNSSEIRKLDLSKSIENLMKYFEEDVTTDEKEIEKKMEPVDLTSINKVDENKANAGLLQVNTEIQQVNAEKTKEDQKKYLRSIPPAKPRRMRRETQLISQITRNSYDEYKKIALEDIDYLKSKKNISPKIRAMTELFDKLDTFNKLSPLKISTSNQLSQDEKMKKLSVQNVQMPQINSSLEKFPIPMKRKKIKPPVPRPRSKCLDRVDFGKKLSIFNGENPPENKDKPKNKIAEKTKIKNNPNITKIIQSVEKRCFNTGEIRNFKKPTSIPEKKRSFNNCTIPLSSYQNCISELKSWGKVFDCQTTEGKISKNAIGLLKTLNEPETPTPEINYLANKNCNSRDKYATDQKETLKIETSRELKKSQQNETPNEQSDISGGLMLDDIFYKLSVKDKISIFNQFVDEVKNKSISLKSKQSSQCNDLRIKDKTLNKSPVENEMQNIHCCQKKTLLQNKNKILFNQPEAMVKTEIDLNINSSQNKFEAIVPITHRSSIVVHLKSSPEPRLHYNFVDTNTTSSSYDKSFQPQLQAINSTHQGAFALEDTVIDSLTDSQVASEIFDKEKMSANVDNLVEPCGNSMLIQTKEKLNISNDSSSKRDNSNILSCVPNDMYGPPKKIRRTVLERSGVFVNHQLESMFYEWLTLHNGKQSLQSTPEGKNSCEFLREKLEFNCEHKPENGNKNEKQKDKFIHIGNQINVDTSSKKLSLRRSLRWKSDNSIIEKCVPTLQLSNIADNQIEIPKEQPKSLTLNSEDDGRLSMASSIFSKCQPFDSDNENPRRRSFIIGAPVNNCNGKLNLFDKKGDQLSSFLEIDPKILRKCQSPSHFKKGYTLTVLSSPSPSLINDTDNWNMDSFKYNNIKDVSFLSRSWSNLLALEDLETNLGKTLTTTIGDNPSSPYTKSIRSQQNQSHQNLIEQNRAHFNKLSNELIEETLVDKVDKNQQVSEYTTFLNDDDTKDLQIEVEYLPITPGKEVHFSDSDGLTESKSQIKYRKTPRTVSKSAKLRIYPSSAAKDESSMTITNIETENKETLKKIQEDLQNIISNFKTISFDCETNKSSKFWIRSRNCILKFTIFYVAPTQLTFMKQIFTREANKNLKINFGIDSVHYFSKQKLNLNFNKSKNESKYWFSARNYIAEFNGCYIDGQQIHQVFQLLRGPDLRFGVDDVEFSISPTNNKENTNKTDFSLPRSSTYSKTSDLAISDFNSDSDHQHELQNIFKQKLKKQKNYEFRSRTASSSSEDPLSSVMVSPDSGEVLSSETDDDLIHFSKKTDTLDNLFTWIKSSTEKVKENFSRPLHETITRNNDKSTDGKKNKRAGKKYFDSVSNLMSQDKEIIALHTNDKDPKFKSSSNSIEHDKLYKDLQEINTTTPNTK